MPKDKIQEEEIQNGIEWMKGTKIEHLRKFYDRVNSDNTLSSLTKEERAIVWRWANVQE